MKRWKMMLVLLPAVLAANPALALVPRSVTAELSAATW
jgi:hypothetical protein